METTPCVGSRSIVAEALPCDAQRLDPKSTPWADRFRYGGGLSAFERYVRWVVSHPRTVVAVVTLATVFWASRLPALRVEVDPDANLPQSHPYIQALQTLEHRFGEKNLIVIGLFPKDRNIYSVAFLSKLQTITRRVGQLPGLINSTYASIAAPLMKAIEGGDDTLLVRPILERPPVTSADVDEVRRRLYVNGFYLGTIAAEDGTAAAIIANFKLTPQLPGYVQIQEHVEALLADEDDGTFVVHYAGPVALNAGLARITARTIILFPFALLAIGLLHFEAFRTLQGMLLPLLTAIMAVVWSLGFMGWLQIPLDPFNTTTPILVLAVAAGHAVQILKRYYEEVERYRDSLVAVRVAVERVGPVMITAGIVAALSFFSLAAFDTAMMRNFGLLTGFGILSALIVELTLIPALRAMLPSPRIKELTSEAQSGQFLDRGLQRISTVVNTRPTTVLYCTLGLAAVAAIGASRLHVDTSYKRQFGRSHPLRIADRALNDAFAGTNTLIFLVEGNENGVLTDPKSLRAIDDLQRFVERDSAVGKTLSIADVLKALHRVLRTEEMKDFDLPPSSDLANQYLFLYSMSGGPQDLDSQIDPDHRSAAVRVFLRNDSTRYGEKLLSRVRRYVAESFPPDLTVRYSGTIASNAALTEVMVHGKILNMAQIAAIIIFVSALVLRSLLGGLLVATPLAVAVIVNFGVMGFLGVPLDIITSPIAAMAVGIGSDYAIYFLFRFREELTVSKTPALALASTMHTSGKAIVYVSSAIAGGYLILCISGYVFHLELGMLVALAMVVSSFATVTLLPALILITRPTFLFGVRPIESAAPIRGVG